MIFLINKKTGTEIKNRAVSFFKDKHNLIAVAIFIFAFALRFDYAFMSGLWVDEGRYAVMGRALLDHPFDYSTMMHGTITEFPPVFPYMLFFSQYIFGAGDFAVRIVNPILGALCVLLMYALGRVMFNRNVGLYASALMAVSPLILFFSERVLLETPMVFFGLSTLFLFYYGYERKKNMFLYASGIFFVLGFLTKQAVLFILPAIGLYLIYSRKWAWLKERRIWITIAIMLLVMMPWAVRSYTHCGSISCEASFAMSWFSSEGGGLDVVRDYFYYINLTPFTLTTGVLILSFFGLIPLINGRKKKEYLLILSFALMIHIIFAITAVKVPRYILLAVPILILLAAKGVDEISRQIAGKERKYAFLVALIILAPVLYISYNAGTTMIEEKAPGFLMLKDAGLYLENTPKDTVIMASPPQPISFYAGDKKTAAYPIEAEDLAEAIYNTSTDYVIIDAYERTQRDWIYSYVPTRPYLVFEKVFNQNDQPVVAIFKVDQDKLMLELQNKTRVLE